MRLPGSRKSLRSLIGVPGNRSSGIGGTAPVSSGKVGTPGPQRATPFPAAKRGFLIVKIARQLARCLRRFRADRGDVGAVKVDYSFANERVTAWAHWAAQSE